jgi:hypothetical protein
MPMFGLGPFAPFSVRLPRVRLCPNSGAIADISQLPLGADSVEKVENTAKTKFSRKLADGRFLLRMHSSCEEEGRRKLQFKSTWSTASDGVKRISGSKKFGLDGGGDFFNRMGPSQTSRYRLTRTTKRLSMA